MILLSFGGIALSELEFHIPKIEAVICDPDWIRTNDPQLRRLMLYPTELPDPLFFGCKYSGIVFTCQVLLILKRSLPLIVKFIQNGRGLVSKIQPLLPNPQKHLIKFINRDFVFLSNGCKN